MDSTDLERERGITILAKNTAVQYGDVKINIVDTPGHADFGGEVERGLTMVDGVLLLVDASEGPLPQTRFVLRKALELDLPVVLVVNKVDRPDARPEEVVNEVYELFLDLDASETQIEFPIVYAIARAGHAGLVATSSPTISARCSRRSSRRSRRRRTTRTTRCRRWSRTSTPPSTSAASRSLRVHHGTLRKGEQVAWCRADGSDRRPRKVTDLFITEALDRVPTNEAGPGEIVALAGLPEITLGETLADPTIRARCRSPRSTSRRRSRSASTRARSPAGGRQAHRPQHQGAPRPGAARQRVAARPPHLAPRPPGRCRAAASCSSPSSCELMRREGFEMTVGKPQVLTKDVDGKRHEPVERVAIDVPEDYIGIVTSCWRCARAASADGQATAPAGRAWSTSCRRVA